MRDSKLGKETNNIDFELKHENKPSKAIMLFHGLTGSPFEMKKYAVHLHKCGYDVFCYSLPGHGSRAHEIEDILYTDWTNMAQEKYNKLRPNYKEFYVSGLCLGAVLSIYLAQQNKDVTAVVALSTTLFLDGWTIPWYNFLMPLGLNTIMRYFYTFPEREPYGIKNESTRRKIALLMSKTTVAMDHYPLSCIYELLKFSKSVRKDIKLLDCPLLLIHSKDDDLTSTKSAKFVYNNCACNIKEYIELTDSYHMVLYDNERKFVFEKAVEFMAKISNIREEAACI